MIITMGDEERLRFVFNKRIKELEKLAIEEPDIAEQVSSEASEYLRTLNKYLNFENK